MEQIPHKLHNLSDVIPKQDIATEVAEKKDWTISQALKTYRHNWGCHDCEGYDNSTNEPNNEPMCENCQEIDLLLRRIEGCLEAYAKRDKEHAVMMKRFNAVCACVDAFSDAPMSAGAEPFGITVKATGKYHDWFIEAAEKHTEKEKDDD